MTNILSRFAMKHNLNIYPYLIHQKLHFNSTHLGKSNIFSDHFKYKRKTFADITSDDVIYWKGSSWQLGCVFSNVRNISLLWSSALKLAKKFNSTSFNLKQEVFIRRDEEKTRRGLIYIGEVLDTYFGSKSLNCENNLHTFSGGSVIFEQSHIVWRAVAIKLQHVWTCLSHSWGDEGMRLLNSCQVLKSLGLYWILVANNSIGDQLNRFLALQALVEGLGMCWAMFGLKFPILLNWVKLRPGIWDGGAISSTGWGATCERTPTQGCLGFTPSRGSKQCRMDILPIFLLRFGPSLLIWMASWPPWWFERDPYLCC